MIFTSESGLTDHRRIAEWDEWYLGHLAAMVAVPGIASAQRFGTRTAGVPPSLAMYTVSSPAVFDSEIYRRTRGMGAFVPVVDERLHRRNLFDGLDAALVAATGAVLLVADRDAEGAAVAGIVWLRAVGLDRSTAWRAIGVFSDHAAAQAAAGNLGGASAIYIPMTERFEARGGL